MMVQMLQKYVETYGRGTLQNINSLIGIKNPGAYWGTNDTAEENT